MFDFGEGIPDFIVFKDNNNNGEFDSSDDWRTTDSFGYFSFGASYISCTSTFLSSTKLDVLIHPLSVLQILLAVKLSFT